MRYTDCPYSGKPVCPQDNRTCRHCVPDITLRRKIIVGILAIIILFLIAAGCNMHRFDKKLAGDNEVLVDNESGAVYLIKNDTIIIIKCK